MRRRKLVYQNSSFEKGFTLLEMIVVVIVIGILASVTIPNYQYAMEKIKSSEGMQILAALLDAQTRYALENGGNFANLLTDLDVTIPTPSNFNIVNNGDISTADPVARVRRRGGEAPGGNYNLTIDADGTIKCTGSATSCSKLGCTGGVGGNECN